MQLAEGLQSQGVANNQVVLQSASEGDVVISAAGVVASFRLDVASTNVDAVKAALESYVSSGKYDTALKGAASEFSGVKTQVDTSSYKVKKYSSMNAVVLILLILLIIFVLMFAALESYVSSGKYDTALKGAASEFSGVKTQVDTSSYKVKKYSSMNAVVLILLILLIIFVLMFAALVVFYLNIRKNPAKKGGIQQLHSGSSFIPAGNIQPEEDDYKPSPKMRADVSDDEEEYRRKPKRKQFVDDDEEEEDYRPARKTKAKSPRARV